MPELGFDTAELQKEKIPIIFIELVDRRPSGFILDGTRGTKYESELDSPTARFIPNVGFRRVFKTETINGKEVKTPINEPIRWIKNETEISVQKQKERGIVPNKQTREDKIIIEKGTFSVAREGSYVGLYDYLLEAFYNVSNPNRSSSASDIYRVIELGKDEEELNEMDFLIADATAFVKKLVQKTGTKQYKYNEEKINALCEMFAVYAETMPGKVEALMNMVKFDPEAFLQKATKMEQTKATEISHALQLNVVTFKGNTFQYVEKDKIIATLGTGNISHANKIEKMADLFGTPDFKAQYEEFQLELEIAKENANNKQ